MVFKNGRWIDDETLIQQTRETIHRDVDGLYETTLILENKIERLQEQCNVYCRLWQESLSQLEYERQRKTFVGSIFHNGYRLFKFIGICK